MSKIQKIFLGATSVNAVALGTVAAIGIALGHVTAAYLIPIALAPILVFAVYKLVNIKLTKKHNNKQNQIVR